MPSLYDSIVIDPILLERARQYIRNSRTWGSPPSGFFSEYSKPKLTVCEKVKLMWERSKWGKDRKPPNHALILEKKKAKPYYRVNERW